MENKKFHSKIKLCDADKQALALAKDIILNNIEEHITIGQLSKKIHLNQFKLKLGFKKLYGLAIYSFLTDQRMALAKLLLDTTDLSVKEISFKCGYGYSANFIAMLPGQQGHTGG